MRAFACVISLLLVSAVSTASAQTFVVDQANGPGANFTSLAAAVAAVPDGATLIVRAGSYGAADMDGKGLTVLGEPGSSSFNLVIRNTLPGQPVVVSGMSLRGSSTGLVAVSVVNTLGSVLLEDVTCLTPSIPAVYNPFQCTCGHNVGVWLDRVAQCAIVGCQVEGVICAGESVVSIAGSVVVGLDAGGGFGTTTPSTPALRIASSTVQVAGSMLLGGDGVQYRSNTVHNQPAVYFDWQGGEVRVHENTLLVPGLSAQVPPGTPFGGFAQVGSVRIDPVAHAASGGPPIGVQVAMPTVSAQSASSGASLTAQAIGPAGDLVILVVGLLGSPQQSLGIPDEFWLLSGAHVFAAIGTPQLGMPVQASVAVPLGFRGTVLAWQSVSLTGGALEASNPVLSLVR